MTFTLIIALNLCLSLLAVLAVAGAVLLAHRLADEPAADTDAHDWGHPLPVALVAAEPVAADGERPAYAAAA